MYHNWKKNTVVFLAAQAVSLFGSSLVQYAIIWQINLSTGSGLYMTLATLCSFVPTFLLSPFAGVWADRYNRKVLVVLADGTIALATLILAMVVRSGNNSLTPLLVALVIRSLGSAVQNPCVSAILPAVVPEENLTKVNGFNSSIQSVITVFSPVMAAGLIKTMPFYFIFFIDVITAIIGIGITLFVFQYRHVPRTEQLKNDYFGELKLGFSYIGSRSHLKIFFIVLFVVNFLCAPPAFLSPLHVTRTYGDDAFFLMALEVVFSVGMIIGGVAIAMWGGLRNKIHTMILSGAFMAVSTIGLGLPLSLFAYLAFNFVYGLALPSYNTPAMVFLQEKVEDEYRGRVFSVLTMISTCALPLGMIVFGPIADVVSIRTIMLFSGTLTAITGTFLLTRPKLLQAGEPKAAEQE